MDHKNTACAKEEVLFPCKIYRNMRVVDIQNALHLLCEHLGVEIVLQTSEDKSLHEMILRDSEK